MAEVVDILHVLTFETNANVLEQVNKEFGKQISHIQDLKNKEAEYAALLQKTELSDIKNRQIIEGLIQRNKGKVEQLTIALGKEFAANEKLNGSFQRTKANTNNLSFAFSQLAREAPAFAYSMQTGILALSNNIPILLDQLKQTKQAGGTTNDIFKALGNSLFGLTGLITIGVSLLTIFGDRLFRIGDASKEAKEEYDEFLKSLSSPSAAAVRNADEQISRLAVLRGLITTNAANSKNAFDQLKKDYPDLLKNIKTENELRANPQVFSQIERQILAREKSNALAQQSAVLAGAERKSKDEILKIEERLDEVTARRNRQQARIDALSERDRNGSPLYRNLGLLNAQVQARQRELDRERANLLQIQALRNRVQGEAVSQAGIAGDRFIAPQKELEKKEDKLAEIRDRIREIARAINSIDGEDLLKAGAELEKIATQQEAALGNLFKGLEPGLRAASLENVTGISGDPNAFDAEAFRKEIILNQQKFDKEQQDKEDKRKKDVAEKNKEIIRSSLDYAYNTTISTLQSIYDAQLYYLDRELEVRRTRVEEATELAKRGNTEVLEAERNRLIETEKDREKVARKQLQLNALLQASSAAIAATQAIQTVTNAGATGDPYTAAARIAAAVAALAAGFAFVANLTTAFNNNNFKDGVIGLHGPGTETSDSIPARLSRGESVMTASETKKYRPYLEAMRDGTFERMAVTKEGTSVAKENKELKGELRAIKEAIGSLSFSAHNSVNKDGVRQMVQAGIKQDRHKFRG